MPKKPWFPHDLDASADHKLVILAMERGYCAVGRWWNLVEYLTGLEGHRIEIDEMTPAALAKRWTTPIEPCSTTDAMDLLDAFVTRYKLLKRMGSHIWSDSLMRRMDEYSSAIDRFRRAGQASSEARREKYGSAIPKNAPNDVRRSAERCSKAHRTLPPNVVRSSAEPFLPSFLPTGEESSRSSPPPVVEAVPVDGACGAPDGAAAPTGSDLRVAVEESAKRGDKWARDWLRDHPISKPNEKAPAGPVEPGRGNEAADVFTDDEEGGT